MAEFEAPEQEFSHEEGENAINAMENFFDQQKINEAEKEIVGELEEKIRKEAMTGETTELPEKEMNQFKEKFIKKLGKKDYKKTKNHLKKFGLEKDLETAIQAMIISFPSKAASNVQEKEREKMKEEGKNKARLTPYGERMPEEIRELLKISGEASETYGNFSNAFKSVSTHLREGMKHHIKSRSEKDEMKRNKHKAIHERIKDHQNKLKYVIGKNTAKMYQFALMEALSGMQQKEFKPTTKRNWDLPAA